MIKIKNRKRKRSQHFYANDHGFIGDVLKNTQEVVFQLPWTDPDHIWLLIPLSKRFVEMKQDQDLTEFIRTESIENLRLFHPGVSDKKLEQMRQEYAQNPMQRQKNKLYVIENNRYQIHCLAKKYCQLRFSGMPKGQYIKLYEQNYGYDPNFWDLFIRLIVLYEVNKDIGVGNFESLYCPVYSVWGKRNRG